MVKRYGIKANIKRVIYNNIVNNLKEYLLVFLIFVVGVFFGVMFINKVQENQICEISEYMNQFIENLKNIDKINCFELIKSSLINNLLFAISLWFFGTTVIGVPVVFGIMFYKGFCLGYTIAISTVVLGVGKGVIFVLAGLVLQNMLLIPAFIAIAVSGCKLYKSIVRDKRKNEVKIEILRHTFFSGIMLFIVCLASFVEIIISTNILGKIVKYF